MTDSCVDPELIDRAALVIGKLKREKLTVVTAESCTAGLICAALSLADGASDALQGGFVTYTKANKITALGVDEDLLARDGSVNAEVVRQMTSGALERSPADLAVAVSGVLGPSPDEDGNPVGLVFFCCQRRGREPIHLRKDYGTKPPDQLRRQTLLDAFGIILSCTGKP
jgi:nicotinamide-nucleotide amidase